MSPSGANSNNASESVWAQLFGQLAQLCLVKPNAGGQTTWRLLIYKQIVKTEFDEQNKPLIVTSHLDQTCIARLIFRCPLWLFATDATSNNIDSGIFGCHWPRIENGPGDPSPKVMNETRIKRCQSNLKAALVEQLMSNGPSGVNLVPNNAASTNWAC